MPRITTPEELFFPVATHPVYTRPTDSGSESEILISNRLAVVNVRSNEVLGVVGRDYRLVTNHEACTYARKCARAVFPDTVEDEWEIFAADAPQSRIYCHIDLRHTTGNLDFGYVMAGTREEVPDTYGPYIRVTNSYNGQRALRFSIGCYRKVCENGLTAAGDIISFSFAHTRDNIQTEIDFVVDHERVQKMKQEFTAAFDVLRRYKFDRKYGKELVQAVLAIRMPLNAREEQNIPFNAFQRDWFRLDGYIDSLYTRYADRLGDNAYAALQAATELASHPIENLCLRRDKHMLQRLAGEWLVDFKGHCEEAEFELSNYLKRSTHGHETHAISGRFTAPME
ncbi:MAG: DUF932 domain-containing protein [Chloroflexi bacterium]|nr:DUF932 domain-containing protein [Chloroflexota bacterium]